MKFIEYDLVMYKSDWSVGMYGWFYSTFYNGCYQLFIQLIDVNESGPTY